MRRTASQNLVILDRDGVINYDSDEYIKSPEEWIAIPGSLEAIARLTRSGIAVAVATNQSGIARGLFNEHTLTLIHKKMLEAVHNAGGEIAGIFYCPHHPNENCNCRKPEPGLIAQIGVGLNINTSKVPFVGDSIRDLEAAIAGGCHPILVKTGKGQKSAENLSFSADVYEDLADFVTHWLG